VPPATFSDRLLRSLAPEPGQRLRCFDAATPGLFVMIGGRATTFFAKIGSRTIKIGTYPAWQIEEARQRILDLRRTVEEGGDPTVRPGDQLPTFEEAFRQFKDARLAKRAPQTRKDYRNMVEAYAFPVFGSTRVDRITKAQVEGLHGKITGDGKPVRANRVLAVISSVFGWLNEVGTYTGPNPCAKLERNREDGRETFLNPEQVRAVLDALDEYAGLTKGNDVAADCVRFCLATGCRSGEAKAARWSQFDPALTVWTKAASTTKQRKIHRVPLGPAATAVLEDRRAKARKGAVYVFPGKYGAHHIRQLRSIWDFVRDRTGLGEVRVHDMRHSFASLAVSAGVPLKVIGGLLGHSSVTTTNRYAHLYDDDLKNAAAAVNARQIGGTK
jgi:integrase